MCLLVTAKLHICWRNVNIYVAQIHKKNSKALKTELCLFHTLVKTLLNLKLHASNDGETKNI